MGFTLRYLRKCKNEGMQGIGEAKKRKIQTEINRLDNKIDGWDGMELIDLNDILNFWNIDTKNIELNQTEYYFLDAKDHFKIIKSYWENQVAMKIQKIKDIFGTTTDETLGLLGDLQQLDYITVETIAGLNQIRINPKLL